MLTVHATGPGGWLTVAVPGVCLLVEAPAARIPDAESLFGALRSTDPIPAALDLLTAGGFAAMPAFALLEHRGQSAHFVVRGAVELAFTGPGGERSASGDGITTWSEQLISGVDGFTISASGAGTGPALPLADGAVWGDSVAWRAADAADAAGGAGPETRAARAPQPAAATPAVPAQGSKAPDTKPVSQATLLPTALPENSMPVPEGTTGYDHLFGVTVMKNVESAAVRPHAEEDAKEEESVAPADADLGDHDGLTMMSGDIAALRKRASAQGAPASRGAEPETEPEPEPEPRFRLELPDGHSELLDRPIVIGRSPSAGNATAGELPRLVTVGGSDPDISRSHVRFTVEGGTVVITDLHSRNGTLMALPGRAPQKLREGEPTSALAGTVVDLGGGIRITVTETGSAAER